MLSEITIAVKPTIVNALSRHLEGFWILDLHLIQNLKSKIHAFFKVLPMELAKSGLTRRLELLTLLAITADLPVLGECLGDL